MYWVTALLGLISAAAPFVFSYSTNPYAYWTSLAVGAVLLVVSGLEWLAEDRDNWEYWVAGVVGLGAILAPFVFGFSAVTAALWTSIAVGVIAVIAAGTKLTRGEPRYG